MQAKNLKRALVLGAAFVGLSAGAALAEPAVATGSVNVRATPWIGNNVIGRLYPGQRVFIDARRGPWCRVETRNDEGWVSCSYLSRFAPRPPPRPYPYYDDDYDDGYYYGSPSFSFGFNFPGPRHGGNGPRPGHNGPPPPHNGNPPPPPPPPGGPDDD